MIYLDSSALVKLAIAERESAGLLSWLAEQPNLVQVSSSVIRVEVPRAVWRAEPSALPESYLVIRRTADACDGGSRLNQRAASSANRFFSVVVMIWIPRSPVVTRASTSCGSAASR